MPHYKDGSEAKVGDRVRGPNHGCGGRTVEGVLVRIWPQASTCNGEVAYPQLLPSPISILTLAKGIATLGDQELVERPPE